jgi:hypothetical protein
VKDLGLPWRDPRSAAALVGVVAVVVFANSLGNLFAFDDHHIVVDNEAIHGLETLPGAIVRPYWPNAYGRELGLWRPVTTAVFGVQWIVGDGSPILFHAVNVVGHAVASVLVVLLLVHLLPLTAALAAGLVFAVHPVHVEAVSNVVGFSEVFSTAFLLGACLVHVRVRGRPGWGSALAVGGLYALGFGTKESAVSLPALIFLLDAARRRIALGDLGGYLRDHWRTYAVMGAVAGALLLGRLHVLGSVANPFAPLGASQLQELPRIWTLGDIWTHYVRLWVFPIDLSADYAPNVIPVSMGWHVTNVLGVAVALLILVAALVAWRRPAMSPASVTERAAAFGVVWFVVAISPVSNTLFLSGVLLAERTFYLPSVGLAAATGWLVVRLSTDRPRGAWTFLFVAVALLSVRTWTRTPTWASNSILFADMIYDNPQSGRSQWILGDEFLRLGSESAALRAYSAAIGILGHDYQLLTEISTRLMGRERYRVAEFLLGQARETDPAFPLAPSLIAAIRAERGDAVGTERYARESLAMFENDGVRWHLLAWALAAQGRFDEATEVRERAEEESMPGFWQQWVYDAYLAWETGDSASAYAAVDTAWARVGTETGRAALDSVRVTDFGLPSLLTDRTESEDGSGA